MYILIYVMYILSICRYIPISGYMYHMRYVRETVAKCVHMPKRCIYPVYIQEYADIRVIFTPNRLNFGYSGVRIPKISGFDPLFLYLIVPYTEEISGGGA